MRTQPIEVKRELNDIIHLLEIDGTLSTPYAEKVAGEQALFAIRIIHAGNVRVFYVYGMEKFIYGLNGYVKKTHQIPIHELQQARRLVALLRQTGVIP